MSISSSINQSVSKSFHQYRTVSQSISPQYRTVSQSISPQVSRSIDQLVIQSVSLSHSQNFFALQSVLCSPSKYELIISTKIQYSLWHFFYSLLLHPVLLNSELNSRGHRVAEMLNALYIQFWRSQVQILNSSKVPSPTPRLPFVNSQLVGLLPFKTFSIYAIHLHYELYIRKGILVLSYLGGPLCISSDAFSRIVHFKYILLLSKQALLWASK